MTEANCVDGEQQEKHKKVLMSLASAPKAKKNTLLITFETRSCTNGPRQQRGDKEGSPDQSTHIGNGDVSGCKRLCDAPHTWVERSRSQLSAKTRVCTRSAKGADTVFGGTDVAAEQRLPDLEAR